MSTSVHAALERAATLGASPLSLPPPDGRARSRRFAMGDPQAPLDQVLRVLDRHGLLGDDGWIRPEVQLISLGDHYDWGGAASADRAATDATALVAWLSAHPPDQVVMVVGNHDLARVGELAGFQGAEFATARAEAAEIYGNRMTSNDDAERTFLARYPCFATAEVAARDLSGFSVEQRGQVTALLQAGRFRMGVPLGPGRVAVHAGVTRRDLDAIGLPPSEFENSDSVARALDAALSRAVADWRGEALVVPHLHTPGDAVGGEGGGALYHRPANPQRGARAEFEGPRRRRYDPRDLPVGLTQIVGHVRDGKCRSLLGEWADDSPASDGRLRHLRATPRQVRYAHGLPEASPAGEAVVVFLDAGMQYVAPEQYPLLHVREA